MSLGVTQISYISKINMDTYICGIKDSWEGKLKVSFKYSSDKSVEKQCPNQIVVQTNYPTELTIYFNLPKALAFT